MVTATISVKDVNGKIVYSEQGKITAGTHEFTWDGKDSNGNQLEDGAYQIVVSTNVPSGETSASVMTTVFGKVTGVASDDNGVYVGLGDAVTANLSDILTVRNDDYFDKNPSSPENGGSDDKTPPAEGEDNSGEGVVEAVAEAAADMLKAAAFGLI